MPMTDYHFVSTWRLQAPIEQVWDEIFHTERWPSCWKYVHRVDQLDPGTPTDSADASTWSSPPGCPTGSASTSRCATSSHPPPWRPSPPGAGGRRALDLTPVDGGTLVRYDWDVRTTKWWINLAAPVARPALVWNHDALMREAAEGLARRLDAELELMSSESRAG
jgi:hypothetical protein